jgi:hypothetical protein
MLFVYVIVLEFELTAIPSTYMIVIEPDLTIATDAHLFKSADIILMQLK